jgi:hypothetical protein
MPNYIKLGNLRIEIPEPANNGGGGGGGGGGGEGLLSGLLAFYNLSDLTDASGNNRTLTNNGNVSFASGKIGNAAVFDGENYLFNNFTAAGMSALTLSAWIKTVDGEGQRNLIGVHPNADNQSQFLMLIYNGGIEAGVRVNDTAYWAKGFSGLTNIANNSWHHAALVFNGVSCFLWLDGQIDGSVSFDSGVLNNSSSYFGIGRTEQDSYGNEPIDGSIDAVGLWSRALTSAEIAELYNAGAGKEHPFA